MQVKLVLIHLNLKIVLRYDRNSVVNIPKNQRVPAPWVIINFLTLISYFKNKRKFDYINPRASSCTSTQKSFRKKEACYWNKQNKADAIRFK